MVAEFTLTAVFETVEGGWVQGRVLELPGVITAAPTRAEAQEWLVDALHEYLVADAPTDDRPASADEVPIRVAVAL